MIKETKTEVFNELKSVLKKHKGKLKVKKDTNGDYHLYTVKKIEVLNKVFDEMYFGGIKVNKKDVGFYFFPIYTHVKEFKLPELLKKRLKGKTCFHISKLNEEMKEEFSALIKKGYEVYTKAGWI